MAIRHKEREVNILITGFGPFMRIDKNPSWLAVKPLHNTILDLNQPPALSSSRTPSRPTKRADEAVYQERRARIQSLQIPVHYASVLDLVPRIHGGKPLLPQAKFWYDDSLDGIWAGKEGESYPDGYTELVQKQWDVVIHVGVGRDSSLTCETQAHKTGYGKPDAKQEFAPLLPNAARSSVDAKYLDKQGLVRGFGGSAYDHFNDTERTSIDVPQLVSWLKERGMASGEVGQSLDPGRYLCDFIFYCSLCEAKRREDGATVIFIHVPPAGQNVEVETCRDAIRAVAWYMAEKRSCLAQT